MQKNSDINLHVVFLNYALCKFQRENRIRSVTRKIFQIFFAEMSITMIMIKTFSRKCSHEHLIKLLFWFCVCNCVFEEEFSCMCKNVYWI